MKALKSQLAKDLLADQQGRNELRRFLLGNHSKSSSLDAAPGWIHLRRGATAVTVSATVVPKAKVD